MWGFCALNDDEEGCEEMPDHDFAWLLRQYPRNKVYYTDGTGLSGFRHGEWVEWWRWTPEGYVQTGSTLKPGGKLDFVSRNKIER